LKASADRLKKSIEYHGGQNEAVWAHAPGGENTRVVEGNRRTAIADIIDNDKWDNMLVFIFPDQMPSDHVLQLMAQRHVAEIEKWTSAVRAELAYKFYMGLVGGVEGKDHMERLGNIVQMMQFGSIPVAERYIHSYIWWKLSDLPAKDWSKFHHAYVPRMIRYFGYDKKHVEDNSAPFKDECRKSPGKKDSDLTVEKVDEIIATAAKKAKSNSPKLKEADYPGTSDSFRWFIQLIAQKKVSDCRHSDGIVAPALADADSSYGPRTFELLQRPPSPKVKRRSEAVEDGSGTLDPDTPAQQAWNYRKECRAKNHLSTKVDNMIGQIEGSINSTRLADYQRANSDNRTLRAKMGLLAAACEEFLDKTEDAKKDTA